MYFRKFVSPTNLHCSQTPFIPLPHMRCLFPLRIYTALKRFYSVTQCSIWLFPLRLYTARKLLMDVKLLNYVCFPYEFTLLSNKYYIQIMKHWFVSPTNLHCSQTWRVTLCKFAMFVSPTNLHCSQTVCHNFRNILKFVSPTNLHCSQTQFIP